MTTIAYRDGWLAADTLISSGTCKAGQTSKIGRTDDGHLWGVTGSMCLVEGFREWMRLRSGDLPKIPTDQGAFIHITPDGRVREWHGEGWCESTAPFFAWGSGADFAYGAMSMGADADRAVRVAGTLDVYTSSPFEAVNLEGCPVQAAERLNAQPHGIPLARARKAAHG